MSAPKYQSRYLAYCRTHGRTPESMLEYDRERFPGGFMVGYMLWIQQQWAEWARARGGRPQCLTQEHHADFDAALAKVQP